MDKLIFYKYNNNEVHFELFYWNKTEDKRNKHKFNIVEIKNFSTY